MTFASPDFLVLAFLAVAAVHLLSGRVPRDVILLAFSLVFVALALDPISLAGLALFVATGFGLCRIVGIWRRPGWALLAVASTVLLFRSEEHTSELQSLMRISYAVFCLKKKKTNNHTTSM